MNECASSKKRKRVLWREIVGNIKGSDNYFGRECEGKEKLSDDSKELRLTKEKTEIKS